MLLEPAHVQCETRGLVFRYESCSLKSCPLQGKRSRIKSATRGKLGWREEKWSDGFLFNSYLSHSCCPPLIFVHGPKKMWWVFCVTVASVALLELSNKVQSTEEGKARSGNLGEILPWFFCEMYPRKALKWPWVNEGLERYSKNSRIFQCPEKQFLLGAVSSQEGSPQWSYKECESAPGPV